MLPTSIRRVAKELQQMKNEPIEGVSLVQINKDNYLDFIVNLRIQQGPYKGSIAHCLLNLNEKHPQIAPYMSIFLGCGFETSGHHHIFNRGDRVTFCIDILSNSIMNSTEIGSGWNPAYTIKTLLMQIQNFISDPDSTHPICDDLVKNFQKSNYNYEREYQIDSLNVKHSFLQPYPPFEKDSLQIENNPIIELLKPKDQNLIQEDNSIQIQNDKDNNNDLNKEDVLINDNQSSTASSQNQISLNSEKQNNEYDFSSSSEKQNISYEEEIEEQKIDIIKQSDLLEYRTYADDEFELENDEEGKSNIYQKQSANKLNDINSQNSNKLLQNLAEESFKLPNNNFIKENLTCYMNLSNPIDDPDQIFGLPLYLEIDQFGKLQSHALTEILSYEGFQSILESHGLKKMSYNRNPIQSNLSYPIFKSSQGYAFNCWLPLFINKQHFENNISIIEKSICELSTYEEMNFKPIMVLEIIPNLINKMFVKIFENKTNKISSVAIQTYIQMFQLLINFCEKYPSIQETIDKKVIDFTRNDFNRSKKVISDLGEFFVNIAGSSYSFNQFEFQEILYREQSARQMKWLEKNAKFMVEFNSIPQPSPPRFDSSKNFSSEEKEFQEMQTLVYQLKSEEIYNQQMNSVWKHVTIGHNLLVFTIEASKYLTNRSFLTNIEKCYSLVSDEYAAHFVQYARIVASLIKDHKDYFNYLGLSSKYDTFEKVHELFKIGKQVSNQQGYTKKSQFDDQFHIYKPNLKQFNLECKQSFKLRLKTQVEVEEKKLPKCIDQLTLQDIRFQGIKEEINQKQLVDFEQGDLFKNKKQFFNRNKEAKLNQVHQKLSEPLVDKFQCAFVKKMEDSNLFKYKVKKEEKVEQNFSVWRNQNQVAPKEKEDDSWTVVNPYAKQDKKQEQSYRQYQSSKYSSNNASTSLQKRN